MQKESEHWYLSVAPAKLILRSSWLLFPAICALLAYDVIESSLIASHGDNTLMLFGFVVPLATLMSAFAIAIAVRSNIVLVKEVGDRSNQIAPLLIFSVLSCVALASLFFITQKFYFDFLGLASFLNQFSLQQQSYFKLEINNFVYFKLASFIGLVLVWQISSILRATGHCKVSSLYLLSWMLCKILIIYFYIDANSQYIISDLAMLHFIVDNAFALIGIIVLYSFEKINLSEINFAQLFENKRLALTLMLQQLLPPLSLTILTAIASRFDQNYIAAFALIFRMESLFLVLPMVLTASLPALLGINFWAGKSQRCEQLLRFSFVAIVIFQMIVALLLFIFNDELIAFICSDCKQAEVVSLYFKLMPFVYFCLGISLLYPSCLNAIGKANKAFSFILYHRLILMPCFALFGLWLSGTTGLIIGLLCAHFAAFVFAIVGLKLNWSKQKQTLWQVLTVSRQI